MGAAFEQELQDELSPAHRLYPHRTGARAIAKREDCDDVLFWLPQAAQNFALVHLTWKGQRETNERYPRTSFLNILADFVAHEMIPTNRDWSAS